ncbi:MAG: peptidoglycan hydrolase [Ruminococcaceae bacterium]|nr:peptidoglycan hydrolase [Oscillospiraceae bacterium]
MPRIYLSPSLQEWNPYVIGGTEEQYMNLVADAMEPYLISNGIAFTRNRPEQTLSQVIAQSNSEYYDLHLALHSNAAGAGNEGTVRGTEVYYYTPSSEGERAAGFIVDTMKGIYPLPDRVRAVPTTSLAEVRRTNAPSVLVEIAYHDNTEDAQWIRDNIQEIARALVEALTLYFNIPFIEATPPQTGVVRTAGGALNIRNRPATGSAVIGTIPNGASVTVNGRTGDWYVVNYNGIIGYANAAFLTL